MATAPKTPKPKPKAASRPTSKPKAGPKAGPGGRAKPAPGQDRMRVANWALWGDLIKSWTTGRPHRANGKHYPVPKTLEQLKAQCKELNVGLTVPDFVENLVVYSHERSTMVLRLPPADLVEASEVSLKGGAAYNLPAFYAETLGVGGTVPSFADDEALLDFHASRIGDYTISMCQ